MGDSVVEGTTIIVRGGQAHEPGVYDARVIETDPPAAEFRVHFEGRQASREDQQDQESVLFGNRMDFRVGFVF